MNLSIIIPAYNEAERLPENLEKIRSFFSQAHPDMSVEIVVVDDGSTDSTVLDVKRVDPQTRIVSHPHNIGKGAAVRTGMLAAQGDWRYLCDSDLSTPIEDIDKFLAQTDQADIIIGSRAIVGADIQQRQARWKILLGKSGNLLIRLLAVKGIKDSQCGFKLYAAHTMPIFEQQQIKRWGYDFENLFLAQKFGWRIKELPVTWVNDVRSKVKPFDYFRTLYELFTIRLNDWRGLYQKP